MSWPHRIRLRAPWLNECLPGGVRLRRGFNCPTGLEATSRVWIVVEDLATGGTFKFNGELLGPLLPSVVNEFDVTAWLVSRNEVCLDLETGDLASLAQPEGVRIEIRST